MTRLSLAFAAFVALGCRGAEPALCREPLAARVAVFSGSEIVNDRVKSGSPASCSSEPELHGVLVGALARMPAGLVPSRVVVHLAPRGERRNRPPLVEFHEPSRSLLVERRAPAELAPSVWLHELVHVSAAGARSESKPARRLHRAIEEGIADYIAAALSGDARIGSAASGELRDLENPPPVGATEWASLALSSVFPTHRLGHALAAELWRMTPRPDATGLVECLKREQAWPAGADTPRAMIEELLSRCPEPSRAALASAVAALVPTELAGG